MTDKILRTECALARWTRPLAGDLVSLGPMRAHHLFVYGTLRPGGGAFASVLEPVAVSVCDAVLEDHALYGRGLPYPFVRPEPGARVVGALVELHPGRLEQALSTLDDYEGDEYRRSMVDVGGSDDTVRAHLYVAAPRVELDAASRIDSGDWMQP